MVRESIESEQRVTVTRATKDDISMHNAGFSCRLYGDAKKCANSRLAEFILAVDEIDLGNRALRSLVVGDFKAALENIQL